jgi:ribonuclease BN (tRNA processing enzyme)
MPKAQLEQPMTEFRCVTLGVGNAFSAMYYSSCLALQAEGSWLLIDCPHPIRKILREAPPAPDLDQVSAVILTHLHGDHASGLEGYGYFCYHSLGGRRAPLYAHPDVSIHLWSGHLSASMEWSLRPDGQSPVHHSFEEYFDLHPLDETRPSLIGPFTVECRRTIHSLPTTALRIRAAGRCLGYSADTAFDPGLIDWLAEADLIIHETGETGQHTPHQQLLTLPAPVRAKMRLIHYADTFDLQGSGIEPLRQGGCSSV